MDAYKPFQEIARNYPALQGLRIIPFGVYILVLGLQRLGLPGLGQQGDCTITLPLLLVVAVLWFLIGRYYRERFGMVEPLPRRNQAWKEIAMFAGTIGIILLENGLYRMGIKMPISIAEFGLAAMILVSGLTTHRWYYIVSGIILLAASGLPMVSPKGVADPVYGTFGLSFSVIFGICILAVGLLDHFKLVRSFPVPLRGTHDRIEG